MIFYRYALTALALAACQLVAAQTQSALDEAFTGAPPAGTEPRFIRGNDRVIAPAKPAPQIQGAPLSFNFEEAPVTEVVRTILGDILKVDYVLHPPLSGTVTMATRTPMSPDQAVFLLESALQANGLALMRDARGFYHVGRPDALKAIGGAVRQAGSGPLPPGAAQLQADLPCAGGLHHCSFGRQSVHRRHPTHHTNLYWR